MKDNNIKISTLIKSTCINLSLKGKNKKEIIAGLVELIAKSKRLRNKKKLFKIMMEREKLGSTGIGNGIAIPHAKSKDVHDFILAFAKKEEGIDFGALDGEKTYIFFALASPEKDVGNHLKILSEISRLARDKFTIELLKKAKDKNSVLKVISEAEKALSHSHF
ncbi:MAG: PTS sugar transporter subunit IIA [Candidatus Omnitrophica bacterium]|nr:PTS sugar transporter subunit IIA [Candidatus Omnitrophota bacterium]